MTRHCCTRCNGTGWVEWDDDAAVTAKHIGLIATCAALRCRVTGDGYVRTGTASKLSGYTGGTLRNKRDLIPSRPTGPNGLGPREYALIDIARLLVERDRERG